ncbi:MAG: SURF1 family protein [Oligoflexia bacterium]|nr:SURF1 family protein [Oligoflexia bacterium]
MKIYIRPTVSIIGAILIVLMLRASYWQWERHLFKQSYIHTMGERLQQPIAALDSVINASPAEVSYRRVQIEGDFDFDHEIVLRNRSLDGAAGVHVLTPLKFNGNTTRLIVDRGFIPLEKSQKSDRALFRKDPHVNFVGLIKETVAPSSWLAKLLAPADPPSGEGRPWVDAWLRVDLEKISKQLPYAVLPFYVETMPSTESAEAEKQIVKAGTGREEMLFMGLRDPAVDSRAPRALADYPVPAFDTVIPPGRHLGYVYEWALMAVMTFLICWVLQLKPRRSSAGAGS